MIKARVVQSNPGYTKELGIRWGGTFTTTKNGDPITIGGGAGDNNVVIYPLLPVWVPAVRSIWVISGII